MLDASHIVFKYLITQNRFIYDTMFLEIVHLFVKQVRNYFHVRGRHLISFNNASSGYLRTFDLLMKFCRLMYTTSYGIMHPPKPSETINTLHQALSNTNLKPLLAKLSLHVTSLGPPFIAVCKTFHHHQRLFYHLFCVVHMHYHIEGNAQMNQDDKK
jgi:hypothetical protein